jgi:hypothetical protein
VVKMGCEGGCCISEYLVRTSELRNVERKIKKYEDATRSKNR